MKEAVDVVVDKAATGITHAGAISAVVLSLTTSEWIALGGLLVSFFAFLLSAFVKTRHSGLEKKKLKAELEILYLEIDKLKGETHEQAKPKISRQPGRGRPSSSGSRQKGD